ncbi:MAG: DUF4339 domain-containing protein [Verrucomicrobiae bacterium]|nr:DUF4339 domain-containing protein [Verrucomicrobiae bacterium]
MEPTQFYLLIADKEAGPFTEDEVRAKLDNGEVTKESLAWKEGMPEWAALKTLNLAKQKLKLRTSEPAQPAANQGAPGAGPTPGAAPALQFDRAEFVGAAQASRTCSLCKEPIHDFYYEVNAAVVCSKCQEKMGSALKGGSGMMRFLKASVAGLAAASVGAAIWFLILKTTGYEFGLLAIAIGFLVGIAVRWGSEGRGGWVYQGMAMFLTYFSIVVTYIPLMIGEMRSNQHDGKAAHARVATTNSASLLLSVTETNAPAETAASAVATEAKPTSVGATNAGEEEHTGAGVIGFLIAWVVLLAIAFAAPFLAGISNIIGLVIIGIGLYEAWKINKRAALDIKGPYQVAQQTGSNPPPGSSPSA